MSSEKAMRCTRFRVSARQYWFRVERPGMKFDHEVIEGVAELVCAEHTLRTHAPDFRRMSQAIYWWPEHEGSEWPCRVFAIADESGDPLDSDP